MEPINRLDVTWQTFIIDSLKKPVLFTMPMQHFQKIEFTGINVSNKQKILNLKWINKLAETMANINKCKLKREARKM